MFHNAQQRRDKSKIAEFAALQRIFCVVPAALCVCALLTRFAVAAELPALSSTVISGSTIYSPTQLFTTYTAQLGQPISRERVQQIITAVESLYVRDGYWQPALDVQDMLVADGVLKIVITESKITQVDIRGNAGPYRAKLEQLAQPLRTGHATRVADIDKVAKQMRALPGLTISISVAPDKSERGAYTLIFSASFETVRTVLQWTNRGTHEVGPNFLLAQVAVNDTLRLGEQLGAFVGTATTYNEYHGGGLFADVPVGGDGTRIYLMGFRSLANPTEPPGTVDDQYARHLAELRVTQPLKAPSFLDVLSVSGALDLDDFIDTQPTTIAQADRLRVLEAGLRMDWHFGGTVQYFSTLSLRHGFNDWGAGLEGTLADPNRRDDFYLERIRLIRLQQLNPRWTLRIDLLGQQSNYVLPYTEQFKIGGDTIGRGFEVAEIAGDQGLGGKLELRRALAGIFNRLGTASVYGYYDLGAAWGEELPYRESAASAGLGFSVDRSHGSLFLEAAKPLTRPDPCGCRETLFVGGATVQF